MNISLLINQLSKQIYNPHIIIGETLTGKKVAFDIKSATSELSAMVSDFPRRQTYIYALFIEWYLQLKETEKYTVY